TSNVGAHILQRGQGLGFGIEDLDDTFDSTKKRIIDEAKKVFKPEFLNRINSLIVFRQLNRGHLRKIIDLEIGTVTKRLAEKNLPLIVTQGAKDFLIDQGYDEKYGARPLRRSVEQNLEDPLAEELLRGDVKEGDPIHVDVDDEGKRLTFTQETRAAGGVS
ncbi:MAG: NDP-hexose 4-ketoreductase, partial [Verrucomicrobiota bacterium]